MDALFIKFLRDMSLGLLYITLAAAIIIAFPALLLWHALRRSLTLQRRVV